MWQDYIIAVVVAIFTLTTLPMILSGSRLPLWTVLPMTIGAAILIVTYATLSLWLSVAVETVGLIGWSILLWRTLKCFPH